MEEFGGGLGPSHHISDKRKPMKNYLERLASPRPEICLPVYPMKLPHSLVRAQQTHTTQTIRASKRKM